MLYEVITQRVEGGGVGLLVLVKMLPVVGGGHPQAGGAEHLV